MIWLGQEVSDLDNDGLKSAYILLAEMDNYRYTQINNNIEKFTKKFKNQPEAPINPTFIELQNELLNEIKKRNIQL